MDLFNLIAGICSILGVFFSLFAWINARRIHKEFMKEQLRQNKKVKVVLQNGGSKKIELPVDLRRAELNRAEIMGRIGMIPMKVKGQRFTLQYTNTLEFLRQVNDIAVSDGEFILTIPCDENEFAQFDVKNN